MAGNCIPHLSFGFLPVVRYLSDEELLRRNFKLCFYLLLLSCVLLCVSFLHMKMVPMFATEPLLAKFFRGPYKERYEQVAILYRFATTVIPFILPLSIVVLYYRFRISLFLTVVISVLLMVLTLLRGPTGLSVLIGAFAVVFYKYRRLSYLFILLYFCIYVLGSALVWLFGLTEGNIDNPILGVVAGAPDLSDQLSFIDAFESVKKYTYGFTFFGGLVPGGYKWNPAVYTLSIMNNTDDVSNIASGGFRLLSPIWGYVSFGVAGSALVPFVSGLISSFQVRFIKENSRNIMCYIMAYLYSSILIGFFVRFYTMSMYSIPLMVLVFMLYYVNAHKIVLRGSRYA